MGFAAAIMSAVIAMGAADNTHRQKRLREEIAARKVRRLGLVGSLFPPAKLFAEDASKCRRIAVYGPRRMAKTTTILSFFLDDSSKGKFRRYAFIALTRRAAESIAWPILHELNYRHRLGLKFRQAKLEVENPRTGAVITLYGADRVGWMHRLYGQKLRGAAIDEAAFFTVDLKRLAEDILEPALADLEGVLVLASTPAHFSGGYMYDVCMGEEPGWKVHTWSSLDNPHVAPQIKKQIDRLKTNNPDVEHDPSFRRNYLGQWVHDTTGLVYAFTQARNLVTSYRRSPTDNYVLGVDFGYSQDSTAFSVNVWSHEHPDFVELESSKHSRMRLDAVAEAIRTYTAEYPGMRVYADPAKAQLIDELRARFGVSMEWADKSQKLDWIELVNTDYSLGKIKLVSSSCAPHIAEMSRLPWRVLHSGRKEEWPGRSNDCCDAHLYAFRMSSHYRYQGRKVQPVFGSKEYWDQVEQEIIDNLDAEDKTPWWER